MAAATSIWKLTPTTFDQIAVGDGFYARGAAAGPPLRVGVHVRVIGAWHPDTNEIDIATVYAAA